MFGNISHHSGANRHQKSRNVLGCQKRCVDASAIHPGTCFVSGGPRRIEPHQRGLQTLGVAIRQGQSDQRGEAVVKPPRDQLVTVHQFNQFFDSVIDRFSAIN